MLAGLHHGGERRQRDLNPHVLADSGFQDHRNAGLCDAASATHKPLNIRASGRI